MGEANENLTSVKGGVLVLNGSWFVFESLVSLILGFFLIGSQVFLVVFKLNKKIYIGQ